MKKAGIIIAVVVVVGAICAVLALRGWPGVLIGSGNLETEAYTFANFTRVEISSPFEFEVKQSNSYSINVTADDNVIDRVQVTQEGQTLKIRVGGAPTIFRSVTLKASVTTPELSGLTVSGASVGILSNLTSTEGLNITVSGASSKTAGKDSRQGKPTYVSAMGIVRARELAQELRHNAHQAVEPLGAAARRLRASSPISSS